MITNWPGAIIVMLVTLPIGLMALLRPLELTRFFWTTLNLSEEHLTQRQRELLDLLDKNPEEFKRVRGADLLFAQIVGGFLLSVGLCLLVSTMVALL